jgi:putative hemolysin
MINDLVWTLSILGQTVTLQPGEVVCDQNITPLRWTVAGITTVGTLFCLWVVWKNAAAEVGLSGLSRSRLEAMREKNAKRADLLANLIESSVQVGSVISVATTASLIAAAALAISAIHQFNLYGIEVTLLMLIFIFIVLTLARTLPKGIAYNDPERAALKHSGFIRAETAILRPIISLINHITNGLLRWRNLKPLPPNAVVTREEVVLLANLSEEEGIIESESTDMIRGIFQFSDRMVREVMRSRMDIQAIPLGATLEQALDIINASGKSRLPVLAPDLDHLKGLLYAKDLLKYLRQNPRPPFDLASLVRKPYYVPETKKIDELMGEMRQQHVHIAIVVDEYGGTAGIVTIEDLLEEIVGEIQDEYDAETDAYERVSDNEVILDARLNLGDVNDLFGTSWEAPDIETIGGFVYDRLGKIPLEGDTLYVDDTGRRVKVNPDNTIELEPESDAPYPTSLYKITVSRATGQRLRQLRVQQTTAPSPPKPPEPERMTGDLRRKRVSGKLPDS